MRTVTRAEVRNKLGILDTAEIADPSARTKMLHEVQKELSTYFNTMGVEIVSVNAQNFHFNEKYEDNIRKRKSADQILINQDEFRKAETEKRKQIVADAEKVRSNALAQLKGELAKRKLTAEGEAKRIITKANQEAYQLDTEGSIALANAAQEAAAIKAEGEQKALAMEKLFEAYEKGGEGLVREALVKFYDGVTVTARPYSPSDRVDQVRTLPVQIESPNTTPARHRKEAPVAANPPASSKGGCIAASFVLIVFVGMIFLWVCFVKVDANTIGVRTMMASGSGIEKKDYPPGYVLCIPGLHQVKLWDPTWTHVYKRMEVRGSDQYKRPSTSR